MTTGQTPQRRAHGFILATLVDGKRHAAAQADIWALNNTVGDLQIKQVSYYEKEDAPGGQAAATRPGGDIMTIEVESKTKNIGNEQAHAELEQLSRAIEALPDAPGPDYFSNVKHW